MARLYDRVMAEGLTAMPWAGGGEQDAEALAGLTVIDISNVSKYYLEVSEKDHYDLDGDFPNIAPPLPKMWMEWEEDAVARINRGGDIQLQDNIGGGHIAVLVESIKLQEGGWLVLASTYFRVDRQNLGPQGILHIVVTPDGCVSPKTFEMAAPYDPEPDLSGKPWLVNVPGGEELARQRGPEVAKNLVQATIDAFKVPALAISFMHCKNVGRREVEQPRGARRSWERQHGRGLVRYHVLDIDPMKETLESEGRVSETGLKKALHICRGHFATYTEDAPLFGHYVGTVWRPQHVRGSATEGVVVKDYNVKAPT